MRYRRHLAWACIASLTNLAWANHQDIEQGDTIPSGSGGSLEFRLSSDSTVISPGLYSAALLPPTALTELTESGDSTDSAKVDLGDVEIPCCEPGELNVRVTYNQTIRSGLWVLSINDLQYDINIQNPSRKMKRDLESRSNQNAITAYCGIGSEKSSVELASPGTSSMASQTAPKVGSVSMADLSTTQSAKTEAISEPVSELSLSTPISSITATPTVASSEVLTTSEISMYPVVSPQPIGPSSAPSTGTMNFLDSSSARTCTCTCVY